MTPNLEEVDVLIRINRRCSNENELTLVARTQQTSATHATFYALTFRCSAGVSLQYVDEQRSSIPAC